MEAAKSGGGTINLADLGLGDPSELVSDMEHAEQELTEREKPWEQRLAEQREKDELERKELEKEKQQQILSNKRDPHLTNLNEDP